MINKKRKRELNDDENPNDLHKVNKDYNIEFTITRVSE